MQQIFFRKQSCRSWLFLAIVIPLTTILGTGWGLRIAQAARKQIQRPPQSAAVLPGGSQIQQLLNEQKFSEALAALEPKISGAAKLGAPEYAELLVKRAQIQVGLHGYETAVKALKESARPQ